MRNPVLALLGSFGLALAALSLVVILPAQAAAPTPPPAAGPEPFQRPAGQTVTFTVVAKSPSPHQLGAPVAGPIEAVFSADLDVSTVTSRTFAVHAAQSGYVTGAFRYDAATRRLSFTPAVPFYPGQTVRVTLTAQL